MFIYLKLRDFKMQQIKTKKIILIDNINSYLTILWKLMKVFKRKPFRK